MSTISIKGLKGHKRRKLVRQATNAILGYLGISSRIKLNIAIEFCELKKTEKCVGECEAEEWERPVRTFTIRIDENLNTRKTISVLAHELVHVKQYAKNEVYDYVDGTHSRWLKERINWKKTRYYDLPWEKEAYALQKVLTKRFLNEAQVNPKEYDIEIINYL